MSQRRGKKDFGPPKHGADDFDGMDFDGPGGNYMGVDFQDLSNRAIKPTPITEVVPFYDVKYDNSSTKK